MTAGTILRLLVVMGLWAACFPLITLGLDLAPHLAFAAMRAALAGASLLFLGLLLRRPLPRDVRSWGLLTVVAVGATTLGFFGMFHAAEFLSPGLATVIANAQPLVAAVMAHAFLGERLTMLGKIGLAVGLGGIAAIAWPGLSAGGIQGYTLGIAYVSLAAVGVATGNVAIKRIANNVDAVMAMGAQLVIGAIPLAVLSMWTEDVASLDWSAEFLLILAILSIVGTALAFWLWFTVLKRIEVNRANAFTFLVPVIGISLGAAFFDERLALIQAVGAFLVVLGIFLVERGATTFLSSRAESIES